MKKILCILCVLFCLLLTACSSKDNNSGDTSYGVPNSLVLRNVNIEDHMTYDIKHNYDSATHIDDVELTTFSKGDFGTQSKTYICAYQYDKSSDLWTLLDINDDEPVNTIFTPKAYIGKSFEGEFKKFNGGEYYIYVRDLDFTNETITIDYSIIFNDGDILSASAKTLDIFDFHDGSGTGFGIDFTRSIVVQFSLVFSFDLFEGICP